MTFLLVWLAISVITGATIFVHFWRETSKISLGDVAELVGMGCVGGFFWFFVLPAYISETRVGKKISQAINDFWAKPRWKV